MQTVKKLPLAELIAYRMGALPAAMERAYKHLKRVCAKLPEPPQERCHNANVLIDGYTQREDIQMSCQFMATGAERKEVSPEEKTIRDAIVKLLPLLGEDRELLQQYFDALLFIAAAKEKPRRSGG
jgi:hypothetical protein